MTAPEEFTHDYVQGYRDGMSRAAVIAANWGAPTLAAALANGASHALTVGTAIHAEAPLPRPDLFDQVRVTSPYCDHLGVGTLIKQEGRINRETNEMAVTATVRYDNGQQWIGPMSAVVPA